jgi:hypothetical protein
VLNEAFTGVTDPCTGPAQRHDLREMILMALCGVLCGADTWVDVAEWAEDNESWLRCYRWGVENRLHWVLDVTFRDDDCGVRKGHAPQNLSALRKFALSLLRQDKQYPKRNLPDHRASLPGLIPLG